MKHSEFTPFDRTNSAGIFNFLYKYIKKEKNIFFQTVLLTLILTGLGLIIPKIISEAIEWIGLIGSNKTLGDLLTLLLLALGLYLAQCLLSYLEDIKSSEFFLKVASYMRKEYFKKITKVTMGYLDSGRHGDFISRGSNDIESVVKLLSETLLKLMSCSVLFVGCLAVMIYVSWQLALISILSTVTTFLLSLFLGGFIRKHAAKQQVLLGAVNSFLEDALCVLKSIKLYNREKYVAKKFSQCSKQLKKESIKTLSWISAVTPINNFIGNLNFLLIAIVGGIMSLSESSDITISVIVLFVLYVREYTESLNDLSEIISETQVALKAAERYLEVLNAPEEISQNCSLSIANGSVKLKDVHFSYIQDQEVLSGIDLQIESGQCVALVGSSGCGKTTLVQLLLHLYEVDSGEIIIGDSNISLLSFEELRKNVIAVMQDDIVFDETLSYNISMCSYDKNSFVLDDEFKYLNFSPDDTFATELLSRGEMQKICVIRAFSTNAKIIILDESMSLVDQVTYLKLFNNLRNTFPNSTFITITHQLSCLRNYDKIFFLSNGKISEQGTFEQLVAKKGEFYEMLKTEENQ